MAVAFDASGNKDSAGATATSLSLTNLTVGSGASRALLVAVGWTNGSLPTGISVTWDSGGTNQALTQIATIAGGANLASAALYGYASSGSPLTSGAKTLAISWTGALEAQCAAASWTGVDQTGGATSFPHSTTQNPGTTSTSITVTSATNNAVFGGHYFQDAGGGPILTLNQTQITNDVIGDALGSNRAAGAASVNLTCTNSGSAGVGVAVGCDILASGAATGPVGTMMM